MSAGQVRYARVKVGGLNRLRGPAFVGRESGSCAGGQELLGNTQRTLGWKC